MARDLRNQTVVITGGGGGLGLAMARRFAAHGSRIALWDVDEEAVRAAGDRLATEGANARPFVCDVSAPESVERAAEDTRRHLGPPAVLVNNAGVVAGRTLSDLSETEIRRTISVNLLGMIWTTRALLPGMLSRNEGHVVTIASAGGLVGTARLTDYCASKFGAVGFDEALRSELRAARSAVRTTLVCPFYLDTDMFRGARARAAWLLPIVDAEHASERIVRAVVRGRRRVLLPRSIGLIHLARLLPVPVLDRLLDGLGVTGSMSGFSGRTS